MDSRMCSAQKCTFWQREAEPTTCKGPERLLRTSIRGLRPGRPHNLPQVRFLCLQVFVTYCANATTKPVSARTSTSVLELVPRSAHLPSHITGTHIVKLKVTGNGATTTLPILSRSPSHPCSRRRDRRSKLRKARRTKHENKESISNYRYSCRC